MPQIGRFIEAQNNCSQLAPGAKVIVITDQDEQDFMEIHLKPFKNVTNRVWASTLALIVIGMTRLTMITPIDTRIGIAIKVDIICNCPWL